MPTLASASTCPTIPSTAMTIICAHTAIAKMESVITAKGGQCQGTSICGECQKCESPQVGCEPDFSRDFEDCNDGNPCTENGTCIHGICMGSNEQICDDGYSCTDDYCNLSLPELCEFIRLDGRCFDQELCTTNERCDPVDYGRSDGCQFDPDTEVARNHPFQDSDGECWTCKELPPKINPTWVSVDQIQEHKDSFEYHEEFAKAFLHCYGKNTWYGSSQCRVNPGDIIENRFYCAAAPGGCTGANCCQEVANFLLCGDGAGKPCTKGVWETATFNNDFTCAHTVGGTQTTGGINCDFSCGAIADLRFRTGTVLPSCRVNTFCEIIIEVEGGIEPYRILPAGGNHAPGLPASSTSNLDTWYTRGYPDETGEFDYVFTAECDGIPDQSVTETFHISIIP